MKTKCKKHKPCHTGGGEVVCAVCGTPCGFTPSERILISDIPDKFPQMRGRKIKTEY